MFGNENCGLLGVVCQNNLLWSRSIFSGDKPLFWEGFLQTNYFTNAYLSTSWKVCKSHHLKTTNRNAWILKLVWLWFVIGSKVTCNFINQSEVKSKPIVNLLSPVYFPALDAGYMYLFLYLIGSFDCLPVQWLAVMKGVYHLRGSLRGQTGQFTVCRVSCKQHTAVVLLSSVENYSTLLYVLFSEQAFSQYLAYRRDNNELLLFVLKQLAKEQITFFRSRYRSEPDVIEIQEDEFTDRVSYHNTFKTECTKSIEMIHSESDYFPDATKSIILHRNCCNCVFI